MYRILIVEDTPAEADALKSCLHRYQMERGEALAVATIGSALEFAERRPKADLILMDIDMPGMSGMEAAELLRGYDDQTLLVFVTNLAQYAIRGYSVDALGFVVKPVSYDDLSLCMDRAMRELARQSGATVSLPTPEGRRVVNVRSICYIDMLRHDLYYHLDGEAEPLRLRGSMRQAEDELGPQGFLRISSGCLINMAQVKLIRQGSVVMGDGTELYFSRAKRKGCLEALADYVGGSI